MVRTVLVWIVHAVMRTVHPVMRLVDVVVLMRAVDGRVLVVHARNHRIGQREGVVVALIATPNRGAAPR